MHQYAAPFNKVKVKRPPCTMEEQDLEARAVGRKGKATTRGAKYQQ